ncbi:UDP-N-acetylmuramoyl-tripeptide--D-alanyl-D-alanine ligase [bacterium]|nr:UDP-N-acetylmuramoyl-tripeptide--D-alanyl-D-alanine ligase [bacterium]
MEKLKVSELVKATGGRLIQGNPKGKISGISTDSRKIEKNELFIALKGPRYDGHDFVQEAIKKGTSGILVSQSPITDHSAPEGRDLASGGRSPITILVRDTLRALGQIAKYYREKFTLPVIAVTGSTGKTTTKDMIASILSLERAVLKTQGNFNNEVGVPLTLFRLSREHEVAVLELGMSALGEIERLTRISSPKIGVMTNVGEVHLQYLGNIQRVARAEAELVYALGKDDVAILNIDDPYVREMRKGIKARIITYGIRRRAQVRAQRIENLREEGMRFILRIGKETFPLRLRCLGCHNIYNALAATSAAHALGMKRKMIQEGLSQFPPLAGRMRIIKMRGFTILDDTYNASPKSFIAAIETLRGLSPKGRKIIVAGDMLELGKRAPLAHKETGIYVVHSGIDRLITCGNLAEYIAQGAIGAGMEEKRIITCRNREEAGDRLSALVKEGDIILIKGSRATGMEEIIDKLREVYG